MNPAVVVRALGVIVLGGIAGSVSVPSLARAPSASTDPAAVSGASRDRLAAALDAELGRLADLLARLPRAPQMASTFEECRAGLERARTARAPELKLYRLRTPFVAIETLAYVAVHGAQGSDLERLTAHWQSVGQQLSAVEPPRPGPLLLVALADAAHNKAGKLYRASLPYGKATGPGEGLYYLAQGEALRAFGDFAAALAAQLPERDAPPETPALDAALGGLRSEALAVFDKAPGGFDLVPVSTGLKEAGELLQAGRNEATALALLDARFALTIAEGHPAGGSATQTPPLAPCADSLCAFYAAAAGEATDAVVTRTIDDSVLPLYQTIFRRTP
jgi:hypothetical protein